jgi:hypothetical protein
VRDLNAAGRFLTGAVVLAKGVLSIWRLTSFQASFTAKDSGGAGSYICALKCDVLHLQSYFQRLRYIMGKRKRAEIETRDCAICMENKPLYRDFPNFSSCTSHDADTCLSCIAKQTVTRLELHRQQGWSACTCPQCGTDIPTEELHGVLPRTLVKELKKLLNRASLSSEEAWRWCLAPGCDHGALQTGKSEMIKCGKCGAKACFKHQVPWHAGYTCEEYDDSHPSAEITKSDEDAIKKTTKPCPKCGTRVMKDGGCNHMRCKCSDTH